MTTWGSSTNGAWKLGVDFNIVGEDDNAIYVVATAYIWTKYATWEGSNNLEISGDWSYSGSTNYFNVTTNSAWSTANIAEIWSEEQPLSKNNNAYNGEIHVSLSGVNYPNASYTESVSAYINVPPVPYGTPLQITNLNATRVSDSQISFSWVNHEPGSATAPYGGIEMVGLDENVGSWFSIVKLPVQSTYIWNGGQPDKKYRFQARAFNRDKRIDSASSNYVYTTPSSPANLALGATRITGSNDPKTLSVDLVWSYPSRNLASVNAYVLSWSGPTSGSKTSSVRSATVDGLLPGGKYTFTVAATNPGDGNDLLTGPASLPLVITLPDVPKIILKPFIDGIYLTGTVEPKTSTVMVVWSIVTPEPPGYDIVVDGNFYEYTLSTFSLVQDIAAGIEHTITVYPKNNIGRGPGATVKVKIPGLPGPPLINSFMPLSGGGIKVELGIGDDNGSPITAYQYRITTVDGVEFLPWSGATSMKFLVEGTDPATVYRLYVRSINQIGTGTQLASLTSDAAGGMIGFYNGTSVVYRYIRTNNGIAPVRVYNGVEWVLTPH